MHRRRPLATVAVMVLAGSLLVACTGSGSTSHRSTSGTAAPPGGSAPVAERCTPARPAPGAIVAGETQTLPHGGLERRYAVHLPPTYDGSTAAPLILNLHGFGSTIERQDAITDLPSRAGARGYVVVTPQGAPLSVPVDSPEAEQAAGFEGFSFWNFFGSSGIDFGAAGPPPGFEGVASSALGADDVGFLAALIDHLAAELCVDQRRIYATGMSNGAGMATTLGCEIGGRLAAIAAVSGVNLTGACPGHDAVAVLAFHGDADDVVAYTGGTLMGVQLGNPSVPARMAAWAARNGCDPEPGVEDRTGGQVTVMTWSGCDRPVQLWTLHGWGHRWPLGSSAEHAAPVDATEQVLDFFDRSES
jgi:polyhydroxybutyrate depolymerase